MGNVFVLLTSTSVIFLLQNLHNVAWTYEIPGIAQLISNVVIANLRLIYWSVIVGLKEPKSPHFRCSPHIVQVL